MIYLNLVIRFLFLCLVFVGIFFKLVRYKNFVNILLFFIFKVFCILGLKIYCGDF